MLNKELSHFAESSKSGTQVSKFLITTYMDKEEDEPSIEIEVPTEVCFVDKKQQTDCMCLYVCDRMYVCGKRTCRGRACQKIVLQKMEATYTMSTSPQSLTPHTHTHTHTFCTTFDTLIVLKSEF